MITQPEVSDSLNDQIRALLQPDRVIKEDVEAALVLFEGSDEKVSPETMARLKEVASAWTLIEQADSQEIGRRAALDKARVEVPSPFGEIRDLEERIMAGLQKITAPMLDMPRGVENLQLQQQLLGLALQQLLNIHRDLHSLKQKNGEIRAYLADMTLRGNITRYGEKWAARIQAPTTLPAHSETTIADCRTSYEELADVVNAVETELVDTISKISEIEDQLAAQKAEYDSAKAILDADLVRAIVQHTVDSIKVTGEDPPDQN